MPLEYLRQMSSKSMPLQVTEEADIDKLRVLKAAEMIMVQLPDVGQPGEAVVHSITAYGRAALSATPPRPSIR